MSSIEELKEQLNLSDTHIEILRYLKENGSSTQRELINNTPFSVRVIRYTLRRMEKANLIKRIPSLKDMRSPFFGVNPEIDFSEK